MQVQYKKGISPNIPKHRINDHKTYTVRKKYAYYHSRLYLLPLQRNQYLPPATLGLLSLPSNRTKLHTLNKTFTLTNPRIDRSKFEKHQRYTVIIRRF